MKGELGRKNRVAGFQLSTAVAYVGPGQADPDEIDDASWLAKYVDEDGRIDFGKAFTLNE